MATFIIGDYKYTTYIGTTMGRAHAEATSKTKSSYGALTNSYIIIDEELTPVVSYDGVDYLLEDMSYCFQNCTNLISSPTIPSTVDDFSYCFDGCTKLTTVNGLSNRSANRVYLDCCFRGCTALVNIPELPSSPTSLSIDNCFAGCTSIVNGGDFSGYNISALRYCFYGCTSLVTPPILPNTVFDMTNCFTSCEKLQYAPMIYDIDRTFKMESCFLNCPSLSGDVYLPSTISLYSGAFNRTGSATNDIPNRIYIHTKSQYVNGIVQSSEYKVDGEKKYTAVEGNIRYEICSIRRLTDSENVSFNTTNGVRIDMLLDGQSAGIINGISRSDITLYEVATDTQITFPTTLGSVMVYAIVNNVANVPNVPISFYFNTYNYSNPVINVSAPCTAQPCDIVRDGGVNPICAHGITTNNIIMNEVLTGSTNVYDILVELYKKIYPSQYETLVQSFNKSKTSRIQQYDNGVDNTKHINTTADSVMVTRNMNLQEVITNLYNEIDS